ncbi:hypothetical protein HMPREF1544_00746 [Mucor circinelloides 1006PhL]|uniref:Uncharacterized protein n=1 Tax=Mucor circinelloides f. circinelloides (strain 1006PhL) TaxID=1220926 RepID=S2KAH8_MUCC1|nr:hypothetical protein HMPREF1544_00746 [Mucor circinelloides 1006PhL]KAG1124005.1 hypothetical protein G6F42_010025 [Rhizopus arrhizus]
MDSKTIKLAEGYEDRSLTEKVSKKVMGCYIEWYTKQGVPDGSNWPFMMVIDEIDKALSPCTAVKTPAFIHAVLNS